jgi:aldehyde:ferredoxin oxidoreductase
MSRKYGRILIVNLGEQNSRVLKLDESTLKKYIGGAGLAAYLYAEMIKGNINPLDPASLFLIMTGPLRNRGHPIFPLSRKK